MVEIPDSWTLDKKDIAHYRSPDSHMALVIRTKPGSKGDFAEVPAAAVSDGVYSAYLKINPKTLPAKKEKWGQDTCYRIEADLTNGQGKPIHATDLIISHGDVIGHLTFIDNRKLSKEDQATRQKVLDSLQFVK